MVDLSDIKGENNSSSGLVRIGSEFQAQLPVCNYSQTTPYEQNNSPSNKDLLVWAPNSELPSEEVDIYVKTAVGQHGYSIEQALALLFWHRYDLNLARRDMAYFTPVPSQWSTADINLFEEALTMQGKVFREIQKMMPDKTLPALVEHYYSRKLSNSSRYPSRKAGFGKLSDFDSRRNATRTLGTLGQYQRTKGPSAGPGL